MHLAFVLPFFLQLTWTQIICLFSIPKSPQRFSTYLIIYVITLCSVFHGVSWGCRRVDLWHSGAIYLHAQEENFACFVSLLHFEVNGQQVSNICKYKECIIISDREGFTTGRKFAQAKVAHSYWHHRIKLQKWHAASSAEGTTHQKMWGDKH